MEPEEYQIEGRYMVTIKTGPKQAIHLVTDNPREAIWEANKAPDVRTPQNICGDRNFYMEDGRWRLRRAD